MIRIRSFLLAILIALVSAIFPGMTPASSSSTYSSDPDTCNWSDELDFSSSMRVRFMDGGVDYLAPGECTDGYRSVRRTSVPADWSWLVKWRIPKTGASGERWIDGPYTIDQSKGTKIRVLSIDRNEKTEQ